MSEVCAMGCLCISSVTLKSISFRDISNEITELVIEVAPCLQSPCLQRLLLPYYSLEILGPFLPVLSNLLVSQRISPVSSANPMRTVKILALRSSGYELHAVLNILRWFPCLVKLYVIFHPHKCHERDTKNDPEYDLLHPVKCLQTHLKNVVFKSFVGHEKQVNFARFFVLNAKVVSKIEFEGHCDDRSESVAYQHKLLQVENRASRDAQFEFRSQLHHTDCDVVKHMHDLSVADPFRHFRNWVESPC